MRQVKSLFGLVLLTSALFAQLPEPVAKCQALLHHGDPATKACYQALIRSTDPLAQAEGLWHTGDYKSANELFRVLTKSREKDPVSRVRWGRMFLERGQAPDAKAEFDEALKLNPDYAPALLGAAIVAGEQFEGAAIKMPRRR